MFLLIYVYLMPGQPELWRNQAAAGLIFTSLVIALGLGVIAKSFAVSVVVFYFLSHATMPWAGSNFINAWQDYAAAGSFSFLLSILVAVSFLTKVSSYRILNTLALLCFISSVVILVKKALGLPVYFFMNNAAADASMIAVLYPLLALRDWWPLHSNVWLSRLAYATPIVAVGVSGSTTGAVALALAAISWCVASRKDGMAVFAWVASSVTAVCALAGALIFSSDGFFSDSGRYATWARSIDWWWANASVSWGSGTGRFYVLGPKIQILEYCRAMPQACDPEPTGAALRNLFSFMHNDYLQILFEQGAVGLCLFLAISIIAMRKCLDRPWLFSALFTYGMIMLTQYPLRFFASAFIGAILLREAFLEAEK